MLRALREGDQACGPNRKQCNPKILSGKQEEPDDGKKKADVQLCVHERHPASVDEMVNAPGAGAIIGWTPTSSACKAACDKSCQ